MHKHEDAELILFVSKLIYDDRFINESHITYTGQYKSTYDLLFEKLINREMKGKIFRRDKCYEIIGCDINTKKCRRSYTLEIREITPSPVIKNAYPDYYDASCNKVRTMADYGFVPMKSQSMTEGVLLGYSVKKNSNT
jgi:hypothetical protein